MGRKLLSAAMIFVAGYAFAGDEAPKKPEPILKVVERQKDVGTITAGEEATATFIFKNEGDRPVKIVSVHPG